MKLRNRFLLVTFGILVFAVATPILILFTRGYQIDWENRKIVKTGALVIKTLPSKVEVYLNDKKIPGDTPETVRFLLPADYNVRLEKSGYQSWTKRLPIRPQLATWANLDRDFITLFFTEPQDIDTTNVNFSSLSEDAAEIAFIQNNRLNIYNVSNQTTQDLGNISNFSVPYTFSGNLSWSNGSRVLNLFSLSANTTFDIKKIKRVETDGENLVMEYADELYTVKNKLPALIAKQIVGFNMDGENLWYVQGSQLLQYNLRTETSNIINSKLPLSSTAQIIRGEGSTYLLLDQSLYALNDTLEKIYDGVNFANYDISAQKLMFANPNEILIYNPQQKNTELILRSISPISNPIMNFYTGYVFFENENKIKAIELDGRDHRNVYEILELPGDTGFTVTSNGSILTLFNDSTLSNYKIR